MWNIILDELLAMDLPQGCHLQAFADDVLLVVSAAAVQDLEHKANAALDMIQQWGQTVKLQFGPAKTQLIAFTNKAKQAKIAMDRAELEFVSEIKYLGIIIDEKMTFCKHIKFITTKALNIFKRLCVFTRTTWGVHTENIRTIYLQVIVPIVTYGAGIWGHVAKKRYVIRMLEGMQRLFAIRATRAFRTLSTVAAQALARFPPLHLKVLEVHSIEKVRLSGNVDTLPDDIQLETPVPPHSLLPPSERISIGYDRAENQQDVDKLTNPNTISIYTDGSKLEDGSVGAAFVAYDPGGKSPTVRKFKLHPSCSVFQAEMVAINESLHWLLKLRSPPKATLLSDSLSSLMAMENRSNTNPQVASAHRTLHQLRRAGGVIDFRWVRAHVGIIGNEAADEAAKEAATLRSSYHHALFPMSYARREFKARTFQAWQELYANANTASHTRTLCPELVDVFAVAAKIPTSFFWTQYLTGHAYCRSYLHKYKISETNTCPCDDTSEQTISHLLQQCPRFARERLDYELLSSALRVPPHNILEALKKETTTEAYHRYVLSVMSQVKAFNNNTNVDT